MDSSSFKLLVVDDESRDREMWSLFLAEAGYGIVTAADGQEALHVAATEPLDLVLLDVKMPGLDGFEVLDRLRRAVSAEELPVIMVTANSDGPDIVRGFELGANDYLAKPFDPEVLAARIHNQLRKRAPNPRTVVTPVPADEPGVKPGTVLDSRYRIDRFLGHGGTGAVFQATHLSHGGQVAVKLLRTPGNDGRLRHEGVSICRLDHPGTVKVLDYFVSETQTPCLVMELLDGRSLADELESQGRLTPERCEQILKPICEVLSAAHHQSIVHRDVKPQNIFLHLDAESREVVKILDFGIAKRLDDPDTTLTMDGSLVGTPAYLAPERFATDEPINGAADVYSLGVTLYELLTGRRPFASDRLPALIKMHLLEDPPPLRIWRPEVPQAIEDVVFSALAKEAGQRPTAEALSSNFHAALTSGAV